MTVTQPSALRAQWTLDPDVRFLNHGSFGACPAPVLEVQRELRDRMERQPVLFLARELEPLLDASLTALAAFLGAEARDLGFVSNATTGVNAVLRSLELEPGDEVLVTDHVYNACRNAVDFVTQRAGARSVIARVPFPLQSPDEVVEAIVAAVTPRTRLALIDHVTSETGLLLPIERIVAELKKRGVATLVDGAHAPGMVALDLGRLGADYYTGNCHKWLCAPKGAAFLWVRRDLQDGVRPAVISHGANSTRTDRSRFQLEFAWVGTDDPTAVLVVGESLRFLGSLLPGGWDELRRRNHELVLQGRAILLEALEIEAPTPDDMLGSLASIPLPDGASDASRSMFDVDPLQSELFDRYRIEVPVMAWPAPPRRLIRISAQLYNDLDEYRALAAGLTELLAASR